MQAFGEEKGTCLFDYVAAIRTIGEHKGEHVCVGLAANNASFNWFPFCVCVGAFGAV